MKKPDLMMSFNPNNKSRDRARRDHNQSMKVIGNQYQKIKDRNIDDYESVYLPQLS